MGLHLLSLYAFGYIMHEMLYFSLSLFFVKCFVSRIGLFAPLCASGHFLFTWLWLDQTHKDDTKLWRHLVFLLLNNAALDMHICRKLLL